VIRSKAILLLGFVPHQPFYESSFQGSAFARDVYSRRSASIWRGTQLPKWKCLVLAMYSREHIRLAAPIAALAIIPFILREGWEALQGKRCGCS